MKITASRRVPPDPERMNDSRAAWAATALEMFMEETGAEECDALADLLTDLRHWCDRHGVDYAEQDARAEFHYEAETAR
jgi:hypothetical protein